MAAFCFTYRGPLAQARKAKREAEAAREEANEVTQRLGAREARTSELESRAIEAARSAEGLRTELAGALSAVRARETEASQKLSAADRRLQQAVARDEKHIEVCSGFSGC